MEHRAIVAFRDREIVPAKLVQAREQQAIRHGLIPASRPSFGLRGEFGGSEALDQFRICRKDEGIEQARPPEAAACFG